MCLEMDKELFKTLPGTILNDKSFGLLMADFLDPVGHVPEEMYLSEKQVEHLNLYLNPI